MECSAFKYSTKENLGDKKYLPKQIFRRANLAFLDEELIALLLQKLLQLRN